MEKVTKVHSNKGTKVSFKRLRGTEVHRNKGLNLIISYENECPSPDGRENPFVPGFGTKDLEGQQE
jgi:hypothetical protein